YLHKYQIKKKKKKNIYINKNSLLQHRKQETAFLPIISLLVRAPWERAAPRSSARCVLRTQWNTDRHMGPLCEVPIM
ncbi:unnamed protein product, partial [Staurois parvus]